jgi:hypothetical protein
MIYLGALLSICDEVLRTEDSDLTITLWTVLYTYRWTFLKGIYGAQRHVWPFSNSNQSESNKLFGEILYYLKKKRNNSAVDFAFKCVFHVTVQICTYASK